MISAIVKFKNSLEVFELKFEVLPKVGDLIQLPNTVHVESGLKSKEHEIVGIMHSFDSELNAEIVILTVPTTKFRNYDAN